MHTINLHTRLDHGRSDSETPANLAVAFKILTQMLADFFAEGREDDAPQERYFL